MKGDRKRLKVDEASYQMREMDNSMYPPCDATAAWAEIRASDTNLRPQESRNGDGNSRKAHPSVFQGRVAEDRDDYGRREREQPLFFPFFFSSA